MLGEWFPKLQIASVIDKRGLERLLQALDAGKAPIGNFRDIAYGRAHEPINDNDLADLLRKITSKEHGLSVAIEILNMRFLGSNNEVPVYSKSLVSVAKNLLLEYFLNTEYQNNDLDYELSEIAKVCLKDDEGKLLASQICNHLLEALTNHRIHIHDHHIFLESLAFMQPVVFLDVFLGYGDIETYQRIKVFSDNFESSSNPINQISGSILIDWADCDPVTRYPLIAAAIQPFSSSTDTKDMVWKPIVHSIFEKAPDLGAVLQYLTDAIEAASWSVSRADILQGRSVLFQSLYQHDNPKIQAWARQQYRDLQAKIETCREQEAGENRRQNESFE